MTSSTAWSPKHGDDDFYVGKEGFPHWDGVDMRHLKQYKSRVLVEYESVIGTGEEAQKKKASLGLRLTRGLTYKAWDAVEPLLDKVEDLKKDGGHKLVVAALERLGKEEGGRKQAKLDTFFERSWRRTGQEMADYIREKQKSTTSCEHWMMQLSLATTSMRTSCSRGRGLSQINRKW